MAIFSTSFIKLNACMSNIEQQGSTKAHEAIAKECEETKWVMVDAERAFLKRKQEASTVTSPQDLVDAMENKLFATASRSAEQPRNIVHTTMTAAPWITPQIIIDDNDSIDANGKLMMLTGAPIWGVRGGRTMLLVGAVLGQGVCILVNTGPTHNIINSRSAYLIGPEEHHIATMVLVGSGTLLACRGACFNVPLRIDSETFQIDTFLLSIGDDIDVILGTPWLADISNVLWNFASLETQFQWGTYRVTLSSILDH